jgi:hypothetical protein
VSVHHGDGHVARSELTAYGPSLHAHPGGFRHSFSQEMHESPHGQPVLQCLQHPELVGLGAGLTSAFPDVLGSRLINAFAGTAHTQLEQSCSQASFFLASACVCHCMLLGSSLPQQASGQM